MAASFITPPTYVASTYPSAADDETPREGFFTRMRTRLRRPFRALHIQDIIDEINARDLRSRLAAQGVFGTSTAGAETQALSQAEMAAAVFGAEATSGSGAGVTTGTGTGTGDTQRSGGQNPTDAKELETKRPQSARVSVLIAMPDPGNPTYGTSSNFSSSHSHRGSSPSLPSHNHAASTGSVDDAEADLPYLEFGVAEVPFSSS